MFDHPQRLRVTPQIVLRGIVLGAIIIVAIIVLARLGTPEVLIQLLVPLITFVSVLLIKAKSDS